MTRKLSVLTILGGFIILLVTMALAPPAFAAEKEWLAYIGGNYQYWDTDTNWIPYPQAQPVAGDTAKFNLYNNATGIVRYTGEVCNILNFTGYLASTTQTLNIPSGDLTVGMGVGGVPSTGYIQNGLGTSTLNITGGTLTLVGSGSSSVDTFTLSAGTLNQNGSGTFTNSIANGAGTSYINFNTTVGGLSGASIASDYFNVGNTAQGSYTLAASKALAATYESVGNYQSALSTFTQANSGYSNTVTDLTMGYGVYHLQSGTLSVGRILNGTGTGSFNVDGGTLTLGTSVDVENFNVGYGAAGAFTLDTSKSITATNESVGAFNGTNTFTQSGTSTNTVSGALTMGYGTYHLNGGTLSVGNLTNGTGTSTLNIAGGTLTFTGSTPSSVDNLTFTSGIINMNSNTMFSNDIAGGTSGTTLNINSNYGGPTGTSIAVANFNVGTATAGAYTLTTGKTITASTENIGGVAAGTFTHTAGTNAVTTLNVGTGAGTGTYNYNGGTISGLTGLYVGKSGTGIFNQGASITTPANFYVGYNNGSNGTYNLNSGTLTGTYEYIGNVSGSVGTLTQGGGINNASNVYVAYNGGTGTYHLNGGALNISGAYTQYTGANFDMASGSTMNTAALAINGGTFNQTNSAGSLTTGTYNQTGGTFNNPIGGMILNPVTSGTVFSKSAGTFNANGRDVAFKAGISGYMNINPGTGTTFAGVTFDKGTQTTNNDWWTLPNSVNDVVMDGTLNIKNSNTAWATANNVIGYGIANTKFAVRDNLWFESTPSATGTAVLGSATGSENVTVKLGGNFLMEDANAVSYADIQFTGAGNAQTVTKSNGAISGGNWTVNKTTGGTVSQSSALSLPGTFTMQAGTWDTNGNTLGLTGALSVTGGTFIDKTGSAVTLGAASNTVTGGTLQVNGSLLGSAAGKTLTVSNGGILTGSGTIGSGTVGVNTTIGTGGIMRPGNSPGLTTIYGNFSNAGTIEFELGGLSRETQYDAIDVNAGNVSLGGTLQLISWESYVPTAGDYFDIVKWVNTYTYTDGYTLDYSAFGDIFTPSVVALDGTYNVLRLTYGTLEKTYIWDTADGDWATASDWSDETVPTSTDDATVDNYGTANIYTGTAAEANSLMIGSGSTVALTGGSLSVGTETVVGTLTQTGGTNVASNALDLSGIYNMSGGLLDLVNGIYDSTYSGTGTLNYDGGNSTTAAINFYNSNVYLQNLNFGNDPLGFTEVAIREGSASEYESAIGMGEGGGGIFAVNEVIGNTGEARVTHTGGLNSVTNLYIGTNGYTGIYVLSDLGELTVDTEVVGASGIVTQIGGLNNVHTITNSLQLDGTYEMKSGGTLSVPVVTGSGTFKYDAGTLNIDSMSVGTFSVGNDPEVPADVTLSFPIQANDFYVSNYASATVTQTASDITVLTGMYIGHDADRTGTYSLNGGTLNAPIVNGDGTGNFIINGGTYLGSSIDVDNLTIESSGSLSVADGMTVLAGTETVAGTLTQTGGTHTVTDTLSNSGTLNMQGGALDVANGINTTNSGNVNYDGGSIDLHSNTAYINWFAVNSLSESTTTYLTIKDAISTPGANEIAGSVNTNYMDIGSVGPASVTQQGGSVYAGAMWLGLWTEAAYSLESGTLETGDAYVGDQDNVNTVTFTQQGGSHTVDYNLKVDGANTSYNLVDGDLNLVGAAEDPEYYGQLRLKHGAAFTQTGGTLSVTGVLQIDEGTMNVHGGTAAAASVANGTGAGVLDINNGTLNVTGNTAVDQMSLANSTFTVGSSQTLTAGQLAVGSGGTLVANGEIHGTTATTSNRGSLNGTGSLVDIATTINSGGIINPGNSPGTMTIDGGTLTWGSGGTAVFEISDVTVGGAGSTWDLIRLVNGATLDITATAEDPFNVIIRGLDQYGELGNPVGFSNTANYLWTFVDDHDPSGGTIVGFDPAKFSVLVEGFTDTNGFSLVAGSAVVQKQGNGDPPLVPEIPAGVALPLLALLGSAMILMKKRIFAPAKKK